MLPPLFACHSLAHSQLNRLDAFLPPPPVPPTPPPVPPRQSNQWLIARAGAIEAVAAAMRRFAGSAMVQLSALLALIPLALENAMMQAHVTQVSW